MEFAAVNLQLGVLEWMVIFIQDYLKDFHDVLLSEKQGPEKRIK